jgi:TolB-like protein
VRNKIEVRAEDMGPIDLKNIEHPVRAFRLTGPGSRHETAPQAIEAESPLSIAVLPFDNMSGVPEHGYIGDGIAENIITDLSRFRDIAVIARNSSFMYKGKATRIQDIRRDLGVNYVLEGSVQTAGQRIRVPPVTRPWETRRTPVRSSPSLSRGNPFPPLRSGHGGCPTGWTPTVTTCSRTCAGPACRSDTRSCRRPGVPSPRLPQSGVPRPAVRTRAARRRTQFLKLPLTPP